MIIYTVAHKKFQLPGDKIYKAIMVGSGEMSNSFQDKDGENISHLNSSFCELTALYWIWKNSNEKVVGLVHYRRYFKTASGGNKPLDEGAVHRILNENDIIIAKKRNYYIMSVYTHYIKSHHSKDLEILREILGGEHPDYISSYDRIMQGKVLALYNMFITRKEILNEFCEWLFPILFKLNERIDSTEYDPYQKRVIGFLAERLFNIWLEKNNKYKVKNLPVFNTEGNGGVKKIINFARKVIK